MGVDLWGELGRGRGLVEAHAFDRAVDVLHGVVTAIGDRPRDDEQARILVRALSSLSGALAEVHGPDEEQALDRAWAVAREHGLRDLFTALQGSRAHRRLRRGDVAGALAVFEQAEGDLAHASPEDRVRFLLNRGAAHLDRGSLASARDDLERAEDEAVREDLVELGQKARHNRAYLAFLAGDLPRALDLVASPVPGGDGHAVVRRLLDDPIALMDRARMLLEAGLVEDADALLESALGRLDRQVRGQDAGEAHLARARGALIVGDLGLAADQTRLAAQRFAERGNDRWARRARFTELAVVVEQLQARVVTADVGDPATSGAMVADRAASLEVVDTIIALATEAEESGDDEIAVPARLMAAEAAVLAGDRERASASLRGATPSPDEAISIRMRWYRARAGLAATGGGDVQELVRDGLRELSAAQARLGSVDLRTALAIHGRELAELGVADALASGGPEEVHRAVERAHASSTRLSPVRVDASEREIGLLARLRRANEALARLDVTADPEGAARLRDEVADLQHALRQAEWRRVGTRDRGVTIDLAGVRTVLGDTHAVAVSYTAVGSSLRAVRIDEDDLEVVDFGPLAPVAATIEQVRSDLQAVVLPGVPETVRRVMRRSLVRALAELDDRLAAPLGVAGLDLVVVPHGPLALVPWNLLPSRSGSASTSAPCLTAWVAAAPSAAPGDGEVVGVAGPDLLRAEPEVAAVTAAWPDGRVLVGSEATGRAVRRALATARVVHLAAHGVHRATSPLFSSLRLADGPIFAHELDPDLAPELVVLSACEVGSHTVRRGDEPLGLSAALLQAGVPTVIASLARVRDDVAADLMVEVHARLAVGASPARALADGLAAAGAEGHLVPFTCIGAGLFPVA